MFKSEKHNLIANIIIWILAVILVFNVVSFDPPVWFYILVPLLMSTSIIRSIYRIRKQLRE